MRLPRRHGGGQCRLTLTATDPVNPLGQADPGIYESQPARHQLLLDMSDGT